MTADIIAILSMLTVAFATLFVIYFRTADYYLARATKDAAALHQLTVTAACHARRAELLQRAVEQATDRHALLVMHNVELEAENRALHDHVLELCSMIRAKDTETIAGMATMEGPRVLLPRENINLN